MTEVYDIVLVFFLIWISKQDHRALVKPFLFSNPLMEHPKLEEFNLQAELVIWGNFTCFSLTHIGKIDQKFRFRQIKYSRSIMMESIYTWITRETCTLICTESELAKRWNRKINIIYKDKSRELFKLQ